MLALLVILILEDINKSNKKHKIIQKSRSNPVEIKQKVLNRSNELLPYGACSYSDHLRYPM